MMKNLIFYFSIIITINLYGQNQGSKDFEKAPISVNDVVKIYNFDTLIFYYNDQWQLVKPICAKFYRISKIDTVLISFDGTFVDYYLDSTICAKGSYESGKKNGEFEFYHNNGKIAQKGGYKNDVRIGKWEYFYENGSIRQVIDYKDDDILILEFWNEKGNKLVTSGNGKWYRYVSYTNKIIIISGKIENGKKNGKWKTYHSSKGYVFNIEKYKEGKMTKGKSFHIAAVGEVYYDTSYCTINEIPKFVNAEKFKISRCSRQNLIKSEYAKYPGGENQFYREIFENLYINEQIIGTVKISVHMIIDQDGNMTNFKPISQTGYESDLIKTLQIMHKWYPKKINGKAIEHSRYVNITID